MDLYFDVVITLAMLLWGIGFIMLPICMILFVTVGTLCVLKKLYHWARNKPASYIAA